MIFRKSDGTLIEINRYEFKNDNVYYQKIMDYIETNGNISDDTTEIKEQKKEKK
jgi:hypothetical protein